MRRLPAGALTWLETHHNAAPTTRPTVTTVAAPTVVEEIWTALHQPGGVERARKLYDEAKSRDTNAVLIPEAETNQLGYQLLQAGNFKEAIVVFQMNIEAYPRSANVYDSLSDGYLAMGNKEEALNYAEKAIQALDKDTNATAEFKQLLRESAAKKIKELQAVRK